jgi:ubiquinone/menaquinone biosynthesis C-methylase UbiE
MRRFGFLLLLTAALLPSQTAHQNHPPRSAAEYSRVLDDPKREAWQKPHEVVTALKLDPAAVVADIGAGTGYFARRFAHHAAKVYAVDIDEQLLRRAREGAPANLETILAAPDDPRLPPQSVDVIFFCNVLHHISHRESYYPKLAAALKPGGRVVILEFFKKQLPVGPPPAMKLSEQEVIAELEAAGFRKTAAHGFLPYQYFFEFQK